MFEWMKRQKNNDAPAPAAADAPAPAEELGLADYSIAARAAAWSEVGAVDDHVVAHLINPAFQGGPRWPALRQSFLVIRTDVAAIVASDGLSDPWDDGGPTTGNGAELYLASDTLTGVEVADMRDHWRFNALYEAAQTVAGIASDLPAAITTHGCLSMESVQPEADGEWADTSGRVGLLLGVPLPGVPATVSSVAGEIALVGVVVLRPDELEYAVGGGADARAELASRLGKLSAADLVSSARHSVLTGF